MLAVYRKMSSMFNNIPSKYDVVYNYNNIFDNIETVSVESTALSKAITLNL